MKTKKQLLSLLCMSMVLTFAAASCGETAEMLNLIRSGMLLTFDG